MKLTEAMRRDLEKCIYVYGRTLGSVDYPNGCAIRLRTGRALHRRGFVRVGNAGSANRSVRWLPTLEGLRALQGDAP